MSRETEPLKVDTVAIFPIIKKVTGLTSLRTTSETEYILAVILDSQPEINILPGNPLSGDRIAKNQINLLFQGLCDSKAKWEDMRALVKSRSISSFNPNAENDWQK